MSEIEFEEHHSDREIIAFVRSNPLLWQKRIKIDKKHKDIVNQAFSQIGCLLSKPLTGEAVSTRWKNLRDQYSREMRKVTASQPRSGAENEPSYLPMWLLFSDLSFLKDVIKPRKTQSNINRKKLKCEDIKINDSPHIIIPSSIITHTPKNTEADMWIDSQAIEDSQVVEESQLIEESQEENLNVYNVQVENVFKKTNTAVAKFDDNVASAYSSSMSTSGSQSSTVPPPDHSYIKKKAAIEQVHGLIRKTAAKIDSVCDTISVNLTQPEHTPSIEDDSALVLIKSFLKKVPFNMKVRCLSDIMAILDKYSSNVLE